MAQWIKVKISKMYMGIRNDDKVLVFFPDGAFDGWSTWVPAKLVREIDDDYFTVSTKENFVFTLQKIVRDKFGRWKVIDTSSMNGKTFISIFDRMV